MPNTYKFPNVYIEEVLSSSSNIYDLPTLFPVLIGYTEKAVIDGVDYHAMRKIEPVLIHSMNDYETMFGNEAGIRDFSWKVDTDQHISSIDVHFAYFLYYTVRLFFANGGKSCYIVSVGAYAKETPSVDKNDLLTGIHALGNVEQFSLMSVPDSVSLSGADAGIVHNTMLAYCAQHPPCFALLDIVNGHRAMHSNKQPIIDFKKNLGDAHLMHGAAYYPWVCTSFYHHLDSKVLLENYTRFWETESNAPKVIDEAEAKRLLQFGKKIQVVMPPSGAVLGILVKTDAQYGIWKAPTNVALKEVVSPAVTVNDTDQADLYYNTIEGKSINTIRSFPGKGILLWGARTLAENNSEWRYFTVHRFCDYIKASIIHAFEPFVFNANDTHTWAKAHQMITNYLMYYWRAGALMGVKPTEGFYIHIGLGKTMTAEDVLNGIMRVQIGLAVLKPAEFLVLEINVKTAI